MNIKEVSELRRHIRRDRSNMTAIYGCYVNDKQEIIAQFRQSTGLMSENEGEKYFGTMKRALSGAIGKNLIDINFKTSQVASSPEHSLLMNLRKDISNGAVRDEFFKKVIESKPLDENYVILLGCDSYDVPFKNKDGSTDGGEETFTFLLCAICPVKQTQPKLHYDAQEQIFHDGGITNIVGAPELGFLFPAFDRRSTNIYNALYYTHSPKESHLSFVDAIFCIPIPMSAAQQKQSFEALLSRTLEDECNMDVVQSVHEQLCQRIELHKESRVPDTLLITKDEVKDVLAGCGVNEEHLAKFSVSYDESFGFEAELHPKNIINNRRFEVKTPDVSITVAPDRTDLIETRIIGGVKYILINAEEDVQVNGVSIHI